MVVETKKINEGLKKDIKRLDEKRKYKLRMKIAKISEYTDVHTPIHMVLLDCPSRMEFGDVIYLRERNQSRNSQSLNLGLLKINQVSSIGFNHKIYSCMMP